MGLPLPDAVDPAPAAAPLVGAHASLDGTEQAQPAGASHDPICIEIV